MHILVTNDDGIESPGLWVLAAALQGAGCGTVTIVAPMEEQSGMSMSSPPRPENDLHRVPPLAPEYAALTAWAFSGTPAGCVTVGMLEAVGPRPDVIVSGINRGLNTGGNVMVSGTVGATMAGALWGVPGLAVSIDIRPDQPIQWQGAAWAATTVFPLLREVRPQAGHRPLVLNVNVPHLLTWEPPAPGGPAPLRFRQTTLADIFYGTAVILGEMQSTSEAHHRLRFAFDRNRLPSDLSADTDYGAILAGEVSVTPLAPISVHPHHDIADALQGLN